MLRAPTLLAIAAAVALPGPAGAESDPACGLEDPAIAASAPAPGKRAAAARTEAPDDGWGPLVRRVDPDAHVGAHVGARQRVGRGAAGGALAGKTVYVSAGHGWYWSDNLGRWATQRGNTHDLVEDFISAETVAQHLIPYLRDMGAYVVPVREASMQPALAITDDADPGFAVTGGAPVAVAEGWSRPPDPIPDATNPFAGGGSITLPTSAAGGAVASWELDVPADGDYEVYVAYVQGPDRAPDAHYVIRHAGGEAHLRVDQRRHGSTWVLLGQFPFRAGDAPERASIELHTDSEAPGAVVSADAARIGGGLGKIDRGAGPSGRPAFEDAARYAAQWNGAPATVWDYAAADNNDDVGTRSRFAAWDHEAGEDAVYVAWHTNAPSPARGTSSFAYGPEPFGDLSQFTGVPGSLELMDAIHSELIAGFRAAWDPAWEDRDQHTAYFGEVNPDHNPEMPATLIEVAFHSTAEDAAALRDPRFRRLAARAIAHGVARYFADRDGAALTLPPEPPAAARMVHGDDGGLVLAWDPPPLDPAGGDAATGYRVYLSRDGRAFDDGVAVDGTSLAIDAAPGAPVFARITATNAGGESRPSPVVGAARSPTGAARVLVVAAFRRIDGDMLLAEDLSAASLGSIDRAYEDRINDESHAARHGLAIAAAGYSFDVVTADALAAGAVDPAAYAAVSWIAGEELAPLDDGARARLAGVLDAAGAVVISGTDVVRALAEVGDDPTGLLARLGVTLVADDAEGYAVTGAPGTAFDGLAVDFGDDGPGGYDADAPDVLGAAGGEVVLTYDGAAGAGVLVADPAAGAAAARSLVLGFPVETVGDPAARAELMRRALEALWLDPDLDDLPDCVDCETTGGCGCRGSGGGLGTLLIAAAAMLALTRRRVGSQPSALS